MNPITINQALEEILAAIEGSPKGQPASDKDAESESPDDADVHYNLGYALREKGDWVGGVLGL